MKQERHVVLYELRRRCPSCGSDAVIVRAVYKLGNGDRQRYMRCESCGTDHRRIETDDQSKVQIFLSGKTR